jgi:peptide/nickel transport system substrate-binding protein
MQVEALWFNLRLAPLDDFLVRSALAHAIDRQALIEDLVYPADPQASVLNCGFLALPGVGPWCATQPFARYDYDPGEARQGLRFAGYDCSRKICSKDGERLEVTYALYGTSELQNDVQELIRKGARAAGIDLRPQGTGNALFGSLPCPAAHIVVMSCARVAPVDPSVTDLFSCHGIPTDANGFGGDNLIGWCNSTVDDLARQADRELDPDRRRQLMQKVYEQQARDIIGLPLFVVPVLSLWRGDFLAGPIGTYSSTIYGMFFNMDQWYFAQ